MVSMATAAQERGRPYTDADLESLRSADGLRRYELIDGALVVTPVSESALFSWAEVQTMPDDGRRRELIDGMLVVTPGPRFEHQRLSLYLSIILVRACPADLQVLTAPFDVAVAADTVMQPDLIVAPFADFADRDVAGRSLLLAVEVLSPSTRGVDLRLKKRRWETVGCPSYWVVDPDEPSITVWELVDGSYVEHAHAAAEETCSVTLPFPLEIRPQDLVDPAR